MNRKTFFVVYLRNRKNSIKIIVLKYWNLIIFNYQKDNERKINYIRMNELIL